MEKADEERIIEETLLVLCQIGKGLSPIFSFLFLYLVNTVRTKVSKSLYIL